jgi:DNA (cytosine-5)-methyltransferase 1
MTKFKEWEIESNIDVFVGGTPCQSFSVAGLRKGLDDPRGNLMLTYLAIAKQHRPRWLVWENVPGVLSSADGRDFGSFLGGLAICGYGFAYRVLDAQYFGVAQRRKRVFVVGYLGDWRPAAAVLFERESLQGNPQPSRKKGERASESTSSSLDESGIQHTVGTLCADTHPGSYSGQDAYTGRLVPTGVPDVMATLLSSTAGISRPGNAVTEHETYIPMTSAYSIREDAKANTFSATELQVANALKALQPSTQSHHAQTFIAQPVGTDLYNGTITGDIACTFTADATSATHSGPTVMQSMAVRRLTPVECERLQGFPDHYTDIKSKGKQTPDGPRYKALGNSMAVPVMNWIGQKIQKVEDTIK